MVQDILRELKPGESRATVQMTSQSLADRGPRLSMGVLVGRDVVGDFSFKRQDIELDLLISDLRQDPEYNTHPGKLIAATIGESLSLLLGEDMTTLDTQQKMLRVAALPFCDVIHLAIYRSWKAGKLDRRMRWAKPVACPQCGEYMISFMLDAANIELPVWNWTATELPRAVMCLREPITVGRPGEEGTRSTSALVFGAPSWMKATFKLTRKAFDNLLRLDHSVALAGIVAGDDCAEGGFWGLQPQDVFMGGHSDDGEVMRESARVVGGNVNAWAPFHCPKCQKVLKMPIGLKDVGVDF